MKDKKDIERWLATLPEGTGVWVDDGGLTLTTKAGAYLEVGGAAFSETIHRAVVRYANQDASFVAEIYRIGDACLVVAPSLPCGTAEFYKLLTRPCSPDAVFHLTTYPGPIYWCEPRGMFMVPKGNLMELKA